MAPRRWDPVKAERVLQTLREMKGAPFVSVIADMSEIKEVTLSQWIRFGLELRDAGQEDDPQAIWASTFRRVQAQWIDKATAFADENEHTKERAAAVKATQWALERLRRDTFDLSRAPKEAPKGDTNKPQRRSAREVAEDLAKPELQ